MKFNQSKRTKKNGGYLLAAVLCLAAVAIVAFSNRLGKNEPQTASDGADTMSQVYEELPSDEALTEMNGSETGDYLVPNSVSDSAPTTAPTAPVSSTESTAAPTKPVSTDSETIEIMSEPEIETVEVSAEPLIFIKPVSGQVFKEFSGDSLVFSKTLGDWRVHNGTDIRCEYGSTVCSSAHGTVASVSLDDRYGNVVIIRHEDGSMLYYCGLDEISVKEGDAVLSGQKLGTVGVVPCECEDEPHLHLMAMRDGEFVEPVSAFGLSY